MMRRYVLSWVRFHDLDDHDHYLDTSHESQEVIQNTHANRQDIFNKVVSKVVAPNLYLGDTSTSFGSRQTILFNFKLMTIELKLKAKLQLYFASAYELSDICCTIILSDFATQVRRCESHLLSFLAP